MAHAPRELRVLYAKRSLKKRKTYHDGHVALRDRGEGAWRAELRDERGELLAHGKLSQDVALACGDEIACFEGFLVEVDVTDDGVHPEEAKEWKERTASHRSTSTSHEERTRRRGSLGRNGAPSRVRAKPPCTLTDEQILALIRTPLDDIVDVHGRATNGPATRNAEAVVDETTARRETSMEEPVVGCTNAKPFLPPKMDLAALERESARSKCRSERPSTTTQENAGTGNGWKKRMSLHFRASETPTRNVSVPENFQDVEEYKTRWYQAVEEELQLKIAEVVQQFQQVPADELSDKKTEEAMRKNRVEYYGKCELRWMKERTIKNWFPKEKQKEDEEVRLKEATFLHLHSGRLKSTSYRKNDLWIIGTERLFQTTHGNGIFDRTKSPWVAMAISTWHGPDQDGKFAIEFLTQPPPNLTKQQKVYAIHGPEVGTELLMLETLYSGMLDKVPILPVLLGKAGRVAGEFSDQMDLGLEGLECNPEQREVVNRMLGWIDKRKQTINASNVCLVHGPFGTGKSTLIVQAIIAVSKVLENQGNRNTRILVAAHTNTAVDRVLEGLLRCGFTDFLRVGNLRKMSKTILKYSLHVTDKGASKSETVAELKSMLSDASVQEARILREEIRLVEQGRLKERQKALSTVRVVGTTCCSSGSACMGQQTFDIVVLDECSQIVEPLSLVPLCLAQARFLLAVGDPLQLPPVLASPSQCSPGQHGLGRALFVRLTHMGIVPTMLLRQYRCHPIIADVPNVLFYAGRLLHGVSAEERSSSLPGLPPLVWMFHPQGREKYDGTRSAYNEPEASMVTSVVTHLIKAGVPPHEVGCITFFRAQAHCIRNHMGNVDKEVGVSAVQVSTVDAFQGSEKDIIVLSLCKARGGSFLDSAERVNVALSRARRHLIVVGLPSAFQSVTSWGHLLSVATLCAPGCLPPALLVDQIQEEADWEALRAMENAPKS